MPIANLIDCGHCNGTGKCQCDECQKLQFGETFSSNGHYAICCVCGGAGKVSITAPNVICSHCKGSGKCQCDGCPKDAFGKTFSSNGHYARCLACNGTGRARIRHYD